MDIQELLAGNRGFIRRVNRNLLKELAENGQHPMAAVVACSDSRAPVEVIFNRLEPGMLFVIRVAGNVVAEAGVKGSIEYAVTHLKIPYLIVLGHTDCGAVKARLSGASGGEIGKLLANMQIKSRDMAEAVLENLDAQVNKALQMDCVKDALSKRTLEVYGMLYNLSTGEVKCVSRNGLPYNEAASPKERGRVSFPSKTRGHFYFPLK